MCCSEKESIFIVNRNPTERRRNLAFIKCLLALALCWEFYIYIYVSVCVHAHARAVLGIEPGGTPLAGALSLNYIPGPVLRV